MRLKKLRLSSLSFLIITLFIITGAYILRNYLYIKNYDIIAEKRIKHLFIIKSFIYKTSKIYEDRDAIITLFNGERLKYNNRKIYCKRELSSGKIETVAGSVMELVYGPRQCLLTTFRLHCPFFASKKLEETIKYEIGTRNLIDQEMEFHEFSLSIPETKPRSFVSCMSRMIAFDDWALLLVALETFRFYGGDLMVAYVECALKQVVELMKLYESEGILKIEPAFKSSDTPNIPYDSDGQTEYANQMTNSHLCLYEFKESAEFIAFTDWDDILIGTRTHYGLNFGKFADGFRELSLTHPFAAAFSIPRFPSFIKEAFRPKINPFSIRKTFNQLKYSKQSLDPKMVVRPTMVAGVWIHRLKIAESWRFHQLTVNSTTAVLLHLKNLILNIGVKDSHPTHPLYRNNGSYFVQPSLLQKNMEKMFKKYNFNFNPSNYSHSKLFHQLIYKCYVKMAKSAEDDTIVYCPSHKACVYPKQDVPVMKVIATHKPPKKMANLIWHERDKVSFDENARGCL